MWLGDRSLKSLLPDMQLNLAGRLMVEHMRLCCFGKEPEFATVEITPLDGEGQDWLLLRIELSPISGNEYHDVVTDLPDRRALELHRARWRRETLEGKFPHAVLFLDLNNFKQINDELGHTIGDQVLSAVAGRWKKSLRGKDLIVRYGGDEFVALVAGVRSLQEAQPIVDRLRRVTAEIIEIGRRSIAVGVTIGVALSDSLETPLEDILAAADTAMYAAKRSDQ
jgi:diguanylate cyclase (GGDEF)-like protein